ncbi:fungal-specific transcription factor domain-containing protein [Mycena capillaripes]|nr:fungal-specific transcription factor domain-containing protein [Mycena capillaripes]
MKRSRGNMACAECQRRKLKCDRKFPCGSCVRRGRADICPTGDLGPIGRGKRITRSETPDSSSTALHSLEDTRVAEPHAESDSPSDRSPTRLVDTSGSLSVNTGTIPFTTEGSDSTGGDHVEYNPSFAHLTNSFPVDGGNASPSWDTLTWLDSLVDKLPDEPRAWALYDVYLVDASWYGTPIMPDELQELLAFIYHPNSKISDLAPHALAVVFFAFALAALADLSLPAYNSEADTYFDLGRTALRLQSVLESDDLHTIQAHALAALYHTTGGERHSVEIAWTMISTAIGLCQTLCLHRESEKFLFEDKTAQRRRALFWEVYFLETYQALSSARPLTIPLADITCEFPTDTDQTMDSEGRTMPGFFHTKWRFAKEITAPMAHVYTSTTPPTYDEVLELDQRLRQFMERVLFAHYYDEAGETTFLAYARAHLIPRFADNLMIHIQRSSFVQALTDRPLDPLSSPYAASFLAAYRTAAMIIKSDIRNFSLYPEHFDRWWPIWKGLVNACFVVGSIVAKTPASEIAPIAFSELLAAVELVERGATHSFVAEGSVSVLRRVRNKATAVYSALHPLPTPLYSNDTEGEIFGGPKVMSRRLSLPAGGLALPSLIPGVMPPPPTPDQPDTWYSHFPAELPEGGTPGAYDSSKDAGGMEVFLAAQIQMQTQPDPFQFEDCCGEFPEWGPEWTSFVSGASMLEY